MIKNKIFRFPNFWMEQEVEISKFFDGYMSDFRNLHSLALQAKLQCLRRSKDNFGKVQYLISMSLNILKLIRLNNEEIRLLCPRNRTTLNNIRRRIKTSIK